MGRENKTERGTLMTVNLGASEDFVVLGSPRHLPKKEQIRVIHSDVQRLNVFPSETLTQKKGFSLLRPRKWMISLYESCIFRDT